MSPHTIESPVGWSALDFVGTLLLVVLVLIAPTQSTSKIETLGVYAVVISWNKGYYDDIDLYIQDPENNIMFFGNRDAGLMNLERDDLGSPDKTNLERGVLRGTLPGEYIVNVHVYNKQGKKPVTVEVKLWRLKGADKAIHSRTLTLHRRGEEQTAFRFDVEGHYNTLSRDLALTPGAMP